MREAEKTSVNSATYTSRMTLSDQARRIASFLTKLPTTVHVWIERSRQRRALAELADRNDHLLADIGLSLERARREAEKPFWVFSRRSYAGPSNAATMAASAIRLLMLRAENGGPQRATAAREDGAEPTGRRND